MAELLQMKKGDIEEGYIKVDQETLDKLNLEQEGHIKVTFPTTMKTALLRVKVDNEVESGKFICAEGLSFHFGIEEGFECELDSYEEKPEDLNSISLKIDTLGDKEADVDSYITGEKDKITERLRGRYLNQNSKFPLPNLGVYVEVESIEPSLSSEKFGIFKEDVNVQLSKKYKSFFNGILLVDSSKSMSSTEKENMMKPLENDAFLENLSSNEEVKEYIREKIHEKERITKLDAALLAILAFLSAKVSRGRGEEISIILWSEEAIPLNFVVEGEKKSWISGGEIGEKGTMVEIIASELLNEAKMIESKQTNMEKAIKKAREIRDGIVKEEKEEQGEAYPTMIIFLTDGKRTVGRSPIGVVKEEIAPLDKTVLHSIGLGKDVEEQELIAMAKTCGGKYFNTRDVKELIEFYDEEANQFTSTKVQEEEEKDKEKNVKEIFENLSKMKG